MHFWKRCAPKNWWGSVSQHFLKSLFRGQHIGKHVFAILGELCKCHDFGAPYLLQKYVEQYKNNPNAFSKTIFLANIRFPEPRFWERCMFHVFENLEFENFLWAGAGAGDGILMGVCVFFGNLKDSKIWLSKNTKSPRPSNLVKKYRHFFNNIDTFSNSKIT